MQRQGAVPNTITYNALISACEQGKQPGRALQLFETMQRQGVAPNTITYNALISASEKGKQSARAGPGAFRDYAAGRRGNARTRFDQCLRKGQAARAGTEAFRDYA